MHGLRSTIAILVVAATAGVGGAAYGSPGGEQPWQTALRVRSEALNQQYGLGEHARSKASTSAPAWLRALQVRSDALNREYELGEYAASR